MRNIAIDKLPITTHCNIPVMTTEMLADLYDTEPKLIRQNYQRNADRFIEGKHCFKLVGEELRAFKNESSQRGLLNIAPKVSHLFLWTARGAARHAKILETEKAWEVFENWKIATSTENPQMSVEMFVSQVELIYQRPLR